jgi:UDP-N-acetylmuramoyl-L-alanyl-D-glutamate--2,6-diaminopimelate ligase
MKLKKLLQNIPSTILKGYKDITITGLCNNSKQAAPGYLFFAKKGLSQNGNQYIAEAIAAGASAIATDLYNPFLENIVQIIHPDVNALEAILAERFYDSPSHKLLTVGITGTNGKTTTSYLTKHLLDSLELPSGLIGTIEWIVKDVVLPSTHTTPGLLINQKLLSDMVSSHCKSVVMEVSSHGLDQGRVRSLDFDFAIFTNLTQDHLDYHLSMPAYAAAKAKLFSSLTPSSYKPYPKRAIINIDSPWASTFINASKVPLFTYGLAPEAMLRAENIKLSIAGSSCDVCFQEEKLPFHTPLIGTFNLYNCLATLAVGLSLGHKLEKLLSILSTFSGVPGRLERVAGHLEKHIFVDYAHTEDALFNVLSALKEVVTGKIFCLFGCGGNRDQLKRPKMGAVAEKLSDSVILTSDNPRGEPPEQIISEILSGIQHKQHVQVELDRKKAIALAISQLSSQDALLIAGKGHENYQIFSRKTIHFDDRIVAKAYCQ